MTVGDYASIQFPKGWYAYDSEYGMLGITPVGGHPDKDYSEKPWFYLGYNWFYLLERYASNMDDISVLKRHVGNDLGVPFIDEPQAVNIKGRRWVMGPARSSIGDISGTMEGRFYLTNYEGRWVLVITMAPPDIWHDYIKTFQKMLESIVFEGTPQPK